MWHAMPSTTKAHIFFLLPADARDETPLHPSLHQMVSPCALLVEADSLDSPMQARGGVSSGGGGVLPLLRSYVSEELGQLMRSSKKSSSSAEISRRCNSGEDGSETESLLFTGSSNILMTSIRPNKVDSTWPMSMDISGESCFSWSLPEFTNFVLPPFRRGVSKGFVRFICRETLRSRVRRSELLRTSGCLRVCCCAGGVWGTSGTLRYTVCRLDLVVRLPERRM